ncbi:MAG: hypothetical protein APR54_01950 [Candidatus Cloacimonas sp. SDB]|nr:MAG: hypothetical protein APR54_01950 [Candidatus Cloacimonas sp. SDB]
MKRIMILITSMIILTSNILAENKGLQLQEIWATEPLLKTPESVIYDPVDSLLYVSNIVDDPLAADGNGFISKIGLDGKIIQLEWITGLNAPKGMGIFERKLYVTDLTELVEISIEENRILSRYTAPDAELLNDIAIDDHGKIYISETFRGNDTIYRFHQGEFEKWHKSAEIVRPNGLYITGNELIVGSSGNKSIALIDLEKNELIDKIKVNTIVDGIVKRNYDQIIFSDWYGKIFLLENFTEVTQLMDTIPSQQNAADIYYIKEMELLLIPTFFNDRIVAYKISEK